MSAECLKKNTILKQRYKILKKLGQGGFGVTYLATDMEIEQYVVIKECFPIHLAEREENSLSLKVKSDVSADYEKELKKFLDEARRMAKLQHVSEIARVLGYFRENNTAYIVMEYVKGTNLRSYMENMEEPYTFENAADFLLPVIRAMEEVHKKGLIHRDLTPENILVKEDKRLKIIDFGSSREYVDEKTKTILVKSGYAPLEQYSKKEKQGPWTDVYGLCAVFYEMITGAAPQDSLSRMESDELYPPSMYGADVSPREEEILMKGLAQNFQQRYQSMKSLEQALLDKDKESEVLTGNENVSGCGGEENNTAPSQVKKKTFVKKCCFGIGIAGICCLLGFVGVYMKKPTIFEKQKESFENIQYAGNYARESERYQEYRKFVEENAISRETTEDRECFVLSEEAVKEWGEPCNRKHFSCDWEVMLQRIENAGWELKAVESDLTDGICQVEFRKYGAILTNFEKHYKYVWDNKVDMYLFFDPVNDELLELFMIPSIQAEITQENMTDDCDEKMELLAADVIFELIEEQNWQREDVLRNIQKGTKEKRENDYDIYLSHSFSNVGIEYQWSEQEQEVFYRIAPYESINSGMKHEYYWP